MNPNTAPILLVEDDANDAFFLRYAFESAGITNLLNVVSDGQQAMDYLAGTGPYADRAKWPFPLLVLLDLKLPEMPGLEVLRWIREQPALRKLVVIILSSSRESRDIEKAYLLGASSFLVKPLTLEARLTMVRCIKSYWLELNIFPDLPGGKPERA
jgi:CheY-like chemotaxis protein